MPDNNAPKDNETPFPGCVQPGGENGETPAPVPPGADIPKLSFIPTDEECRDLWDRFDMLPHIRDHSLTVACVATFVAQKAREAGLDVNVGEVRASALLHDIAKTYSIHYGGNHCQLGGAWVQELTGNPALAQGVIHHVNWPGEIDLKAHFLPLTVIYSDKRVKHNRVVTLLERFDDLLKRYGTTEYIRERIERSFNQAREIERALSQAIGVDLNAHPFDCGGLVA